MMPEFDRTHRARFTLTLTAALCFLGACVTLESEPEPDRAEKGPQSAGESVGSTLVSYQPLEISDETRTVSVKVRGGQTVLKIGSTTVTFRAHEGYRGRLTAQGGWLRVGELAVQYDATRLQLRSPKGWANIDLADGLNLHADQDGTIGRSIFKS